MTASRPIRRADLDAQFAWTAFSNMVVADTAVAPGATAVEPDDVRLGAFARDVAAPQFEQLGARVQIDPLNNVIGRFGPASGAELHLVGYPVNHHGNDMTAPTEPSRETVVEGELWRGLGASQGKGALTAALVAIEALVRAGSELAGKLIVSACSEGSSTHQSSTRLYEQLDPAPASGVILVGTDNRISLGNRGRVDVLVELVGVSTHSSSPLLGANPIDLLPEVLHRLRRAEMNTVPDPRMGGRAMVAYRLECGPVAPHTTPRTCRIVFDRRMLPGDDPSDIVNGLSEALRDLDGAVRVAVRQGPTMLPALVSSNAPVVRSLQEGALIGLGRTLTEFFPPYTFDAGYACSLGIPTVMFGPSTSDLNGRGVTGEDVVLADAVLDAAVVLANGIQNHAISKL